MSITVNNRRDPQRRAPKDPGAIKGKIEAQLLCRKRKGDTAMVEERQNSNRDV